MEFQIIAPGGKELEIISSLPVDYKGLLLPGHMATEVKSVFGNMIFQHYEGKGFNIWFSNYNIQQQTTLIGKGDLKMLELHIHLLNAAETDWNGRGEVLVKPYQYNLTFTPFMDNEANFGAGKTYQTFDIHFSFDYLQALATHFPLLGRFLESVTKEIPATLSGIDRFLTPEMIVLVNQVLNCPYHNGVAAFFIEAKVIELLLMVLQECSHETPLAPIKLSAYDVEMLHHVKDLVVSDFENPLSLIQLSRKVGINDFKLKKGFKYLFGTTVFDYMNKMRMQKAKQLLLETKLPIEDISIMTGFEFTSNFNKAFKKHFGYTAAYLRKQKGF